MMIQLSYYSWLGLFLLLLLMSAALFVLWLADRRIMHRSLRSIAVVAGQLLVIGLCVWILVRLNAWWADALLLTLMSAVASVKILLRFRLPWRRFLLPMLLSMLVGGGAVLASLLLLLCPWSLAGVTMVAVSLIAVLVGHLYVSMGRALQFYVSSLRATQLHYRYLLASGASHIEAVMPSVRRSLRAALLPSLRQMVAPLLIAPPLLFCGLLLGGVEPVAAIVATFLLMLAQFASSVLSVALLLWVSDRILFNRQGQFLLP